MKRNPPVIPVNFPAKAGRSLEQMQPPANPTPKPHR